VGYYPNSSFLHLDVRGYNSYWIDYAGPGEAPRKRSGKKHSQKGKKEEVVVVDSHDEPAPEPPTTALPESPEAPADGPTDETKDQEKPPEPPPPPPKSD
jgi:hypothetical protein